MSKSPQSVPINPHVVPLHKRANVWKWQAKDKDGAMLESAPGKLWFIARGPTSKAEMIEAATLMLNNHRLDAIRAGLPDPGYVVIQESIEPQGEDAGEFGGWQPAGAERIELPTSPAVRKHLNEITDGVIPIEPQ